MNSTAMMAKWDPWQTATVRVRRVIDETPGVRTYELAFEDDLLAAQYDWQPGQFNMLHAPGVGEAAISISGGDRKNQYLRHTIRLVGSVTGALDAGVGASFGLRGPFGKPWPTRQFEQPADPKKDVIIAAGGIGLAPLRSLVVHLMNHSDQVGQVSVLVGARSPADLLYLPEYSSWQDRGVHVQTTVDRATSGWTGHVGVVTLLLERLSIPNPDSTVVMTCGPEVMMRYVAQSALHRGIASENIWVTLERHMNCAFGLCGHCQLGSEFICKDGPVFRHDRVSEWLHIQGL